MNPTRFLKAFNGRFSRPGIELEDLTGEVIGGGEEMNKAGRFFCGVEPPEGMALEGGGAGGFAQCGGHAGLEESREDTIDANVTTSELFRVAFRQSDEAGFGGGVGGLSGGRLQGGVGPNIDDVSIPRPHHPTGGGLRAEVGAFEVGIDDIGPVRG